jgi:NitT/TauT family transport system substrate-binding protein
VDAAKVVYPYFRQDEKLIRYVLTEPPDRVSYRMLNPTDQEMEGIRDMGIKAGILTTKTDMKDLLDRSFIPTDIKAADIDMSTAGQPN